MAAEARRGARVAVVLGQAVAGTPVVPEDVRLVAAKVVAHDLPQAAAQLSSCRNTEVITGLEFVERVAQPVAENSRARDRMASSISGVSTPVKVFCCEGW